MCYKVALVILAFVATIPAANWMIGNVGTTCIPNGPCLIPVGFGLSAPSGVLMIGCALVLRDLVQRYGGNFLVVVVITTGAALSFLISSSTVAWASAAAFLISELADFVVYTPLAKRRMALAVVVSGIVGAVVDSALFLWLAFGNLDFLAGQVIGKLYASVLFGLWLTWRRIHPC